MATQRKIAKPAAKPRPAPAPQRFIFTPGNSGQPRLTREQQKAQRAQALLEAAWQLFCEIGYEDLTIEAVAERAGYSRQPVYTLFGDKQTLFCELQRRATIEVMDLLFAHLKPGLTLRQMLGQVAQIVATQLNTKRTSHGDQLFIVAQTIALSRPELATMLREQARWVIEEIARLITRSTLAPGETLRGEPERIAAHIAAMINGLTTVQFQTGRRYASAEDLAEIFMFCAVGKA